MDKFQLKLKLDPKIISDAQLLLYYVHRKNSEVIADSKNIHVEKCLHNKVESNWKDNNLYPGEVAALRIKSAPNSLCAVTAVDKSNFFLGYNKPLNVHSLLHPFVQERVPKSGYVPHCVSNGKSRSEIFANNLEEYELRRKRRSLGLTKLEDFDTHDVFSVRN